MSSSTGGKLIILEKGKNCYNCLDMPLKGKKALIIGFVLALFIKTCKSPDHLRVELCNHTSLRYRDEVTAPIYTFTPCLAA